METNFEYLGDGVYVGLENGRVWLYAGSHIHPTERICLEPEVLQNFEKYIEKLKKLNENN